MGHKKGFMGEVEVEFRQIGGKAVFPSKYLGAE
jgi:hypothetical protein